MTEKVSSSSALELMSRELKRARIEKDLSLDDVSRQVTIQKSYLEKIEDGDFGFLSRAYVFAYIKSYAKFLGVGNDEQLEQCRNDLQLSGAVKRAVEDEGSSEVHQKQRSRSQRDESGPRNNNSRVSWKTISVVIVLIVVVVLAGLYFYDNNRISDTPAPLPVAMPSAVVEDTVAVAEQIVDSLAIKSENRSGGTALAADTPATKETPAKSGVAQPSSEPPSVPESSSPKLNP